MIACGGFLHRFKDYPYCAENGVPVVANASNANTNYDLCKLVKPKIYHQNMNKSSRKGTVSGKTVSHGV